ncbi:MAG: M1 family metallopeptidase [Phycisphaerales bacterium]|nr:M1 family metallopeptidase [Phycisphaerales bacterium]
MHHCPFPLRCLAILVGSCLLVGCSSTARRSGGDAAADSEWFRRPGSLDRDTVFSELRLSEPSAIRTAAGTPGPAYWQQSADYQINATFDEATETITGKEQIVYRNHSPHPLPFLWIHLEQNYFKDHSIGNLMREEGGRFGNRGAFAGGCVIKGIRLVESVMEPPAGSPQAATAFPSFNDSSARNDLTYAIYDTVCRVDLPKPMAPGGDSVVLEIEWSFKMPPYGADRLGIQPAEQGAIYQFAQWFPAIAVYDDIHGWNTHGYLGQGEFYTNFGRYDVSLTVPRSHIVAATGILTNPEDVLTATQLDRLNSAKNSESTVLIRKPEEVGDPTSRPPGDGSLTWHFRAHDVRTFAWTSSASYIWDAAHIPERGISPADGAKLGTDIPTGTLVQSVYPKEALPLWSQSTRMLKSAIEGYGKRWFKYPYPSAINVNGRAGGMEYPMIIFCGERKNDKGLYGVTTHEIGHNWFPMIVNTDEKRHAWMDEGFNSFINYYSNAEYWNQPPGGRGNAADFAQAMLEPDQQPMDTPADRIRDGRLGTLQYAKPATMLVLLREVVLGEARFDAAFRSYINTWAFKSPRPWDFIRCMENASGADLAWFWRGWIYGTGTLDQGITSADFNPASRRAHATFENRGELVMPLTYRVTYSDGSTADRHIPVEAWFTRTVFTASWDSGGKTPIKVEIDPDRALPDTDRSNNTWQ